MASYQMLNEGDAANDIVMKCTAAMTSKYIVVMLGAEGYVSTPTAITDVPYGILQTTGATAGDLVQVRPISSGKRSLVCANAAFSANDILGIAATGGKVDTAVSTNYPIGIALGAATALNDYVAAQLGSIVAKA